MTTRSLDVMRSRPGLYVIVSFGHVGPVEVDTEGRVYQCTLEDGHPRDGELVEGGWGTGPGSDDYSDCEALVAAGLMTKRSGGPLSGGDPVYRVTDAGQDALLGRKTPNARGNARP